MADAHRHEWYVAAMTHGQPFAICKDEDCAKTLAPYMMDRYLNAVECFSAEDALHIADCIATDSAIAFPYADDLGDYAKALED